MPDDEQKIIIDEDWKSRVQREKEEAAKAAVEQPAEQPAQGSPEGPPPASFDGLLSTLAMQAMVYLGVLAQREAEEVVVDLASAKYMIDMIIMLRDKTKGNLTPEEQGHLSETLADLQHAFVVRSQQLHEAAMREAGIDLNRKM